MLRGLPSPAPARVFRQPVRRALLEEPTQHFVQLRVPVAQGVGLLEEAHGHDGDYPPIAAACGRPQRFCSLLIC